MEKNTLKKVIRISSLIWFLGIPALVCFVSAIILLVKIMAEKNEQSKLSSTDEHNELGLGVSGLFPFLWIPNIVDYVTNPKGFEDRIIGIGKKMDDKLDNMEKTKKAKEDKKEDK